MTTRDVDEDRWVRAARLGDEHAFAKLIETHGPGMLRFAQRMGADDQTASDAVQEALISAWRNLGDFEGRSSFKTWLYRLVHRRVVDQLRRRRSIPTGDLTERLEEQAARSSGPDDPARAVLEDELVAALHRALLGLPRLQRACWLLRGVEAMSYAEIAEALNTTTSTVRGCLARARVTVAEQMEDWR